MPLLFNVRDFGSAFTYKNFQILRLACPSTMMMHVVDGDATGDRLIDTLVILT